MDARESWKKKAMDKELVSIMTMDMYNEFTNLITILLDHIPGFKDCLGVL